MSGPPPRDLGDGARVVVVPYDPGWPATYAALATRIAAALGDGVRELHHVGSTSVPGLAAKPVIDIVLVVDDSADEPAYRDALVDEGSAREPEERP